MSYQQVAENDIAQQTVMELLRDLKRDWDADRDK